MYYLLMRPKERQFYRSQA